MILSVNSATPWSHGRDPFWCISSYSGFEGRRLTSTICSSIDNLQEQIGIFVQISP
jgi:hypothetical protein